MIGTIPPEKALEFMRQHQADNYGGFQAALVAAGRFNESVRLVIFRLSNSTLRTDALMQSQRFNRGSHAGRGAEARTRLADILG